MSGARYCGPLLLALLAVMPPAPQALAAASGVPAQSDPELRAVVQQAIEQAQCFADKYDSAVWYTLMEPKLRRHVKNDRERPEILQSVYCETHRPHATVLHWGLVMAAEGVESRCGGWAVSAS